MTGRWTQEAARAFGTGRAQRLVLNYALGFDEPSLDFLTGLPIRELVVTDRRLRDLSPVHSLGAPCRFCTSRPIRFSLSM